MRFVSFEVKGVREISDHECQVVDDEEAEFFSLYGRDDRGFAHCIGDFNSREAAEFIQSAIE